MSIWAAIAGAGQEYGRQLEDKRRLAMELEKEETLAEREEKRRKGRIEWDQKNQATGNFAYDDEAGAKTPLSKEGTPIGAPIPMTASEIAARQLELRKMQSEGRDIDVKDRTRDIQLGAGVGSIEHGITAEEQKRLSAMGYQGALTDQATAQAGKTRKETELLGMGAPGKPATAADVIRALGNSLEELSGMAQIDPLTGRSSFGETTPEQEQGLRKLMEEMQYMSEAARNPSNRDAVLAGAANIQARAIALMYSVPEEIAKKAVAQGATVSTADQYLATERSGGATYP